MASTPGPPPPPQLPSSAPPLPATPPGGPLQNRNVLIGIAVAAVVVLMLSCCCCGGCVMMNRSLGAGSRLVGTWKGKDTYGLGIDFEIQFKSNGRYEYTYKSALGAATNTGDWRVKLVEDDRYILDTVYDGSPDETIGWTATFEASDQMVLNQPNGDSWRIKKQ